MDNGRAGQTCFVETVPTPAPGEARSPRALPAFPTVRPGSASPCPKGDAVLNLRSRSRARLATAPARADAKPSAPAEPLDLFAPAPADDPAAADPAALARAATLASGRAMKARRWSEAKALAGLAESYARLGERARAGGRRSRPWICGCCTRC